MQNRWGKIVRKGARVNATLPRGGHIEATVERCYIMRGYGKRAKLSTGHDVALDDIFRVIARQERRP